MLTPDSSLLPVGTSLLQNTISDIIDLSRMVVIYTVVLSHDKTWLDLHVELSILFVLK